MKNQKIKNRLVSYALCLAVMSGFASSPALAREMTPYPKIKLQTLDKGTARTMTFDAKVGNTLKFGKLYMKVLSCQKSAPTDQPESAAFIQIWEVSPQQQPEWVFSGWMFSSSPALSAMDHPLYDVWVVECLPDENAAPPQEAVTEDNAAPVEKQEDLLQDSQ